MSTGLSKVQDDHKEIYTGLNRYGKALDKVPCLPTPSHYTIVSNIIDIQSSLHLFHERL